MTRGSNQVMQRALLNLRRWLAERLLRWSRRLEPQTSAAEQSAAELALAEPAPVALVEALAVEPVPPALALSPALREPISLEGAVQQRDFSVLKREAADCLAALGAAHALVTSARLSQLQDLRHDFSEGELPAEALAAMSADYQGWHNDQVRLFDALGLVLRMRVPQGTVFDQLDPSIHGQARSHLETLSLEYHRGQLNAQFNPPPERHS